MSDYVTAAAAAKKIRAAIKTELGRNSREVSVRASNYAGGDSIRCTIKVPGVTTAEVEAIANSAQSFRRCEITGEILSGGNRFVFVSYDQGLRSPMMDIIRERLAAGERIADTIEIVRHGSDTFEIYHNPTGDEYGAERQDAYGSDSCAHQLAHLMLNNGLDFAATTPAPVNSQADWLDSIGA